MMLAFLGPSRSFGFSVFPDAKKRGLDAQSLAILVSSSVSLRLAIPMPASLKAGFLRGEKVGEVDRAAWLKISRSLLLAARI